MHLWETQRFCHIQWIGFSEILNRKPSIFPWNMGFSCKLSLIEISFSRGWSQPYYHIPIFFPWPCRFSATPMKLWPRGTDGIPYGFVWRCLKIGTMLCPTHCFFLGVKCETKQFTIKFGGLVLFITKFNGWLFEYYCLDAAICFILHGVELLVDFPPQPHDNFWYTVCKKACIYRFFIGKVYKPLQFDNTQSETLWTMFSCLVAHHD